MKPTAAKPRLAVATSNWKRLSAQPKIDEFVPKKDIDEPYLRDPYYIAPDGDVGQQAFAVIRDAIVKKEW